MSHALQTVSGVWNREILLPSSLPPSTVGPEAGVGVPGGPWDVSKVKTCESRRLRYTYHRHLPGIWEGRIVHCGSVGRVLDLRPGVQILPSRPESKGQDSERYGRKG